MRPLTALLLSVFLVASACTGESEPAGSPTSTAASPSSTPTPSPSPTAAAYPRAPLQNGAPKPIVALLRDGTIGVLSAADGSLHHVLARPGEGEYFHLDQLSPNGRIVYFSVLDEQDGSPVGHSYRKIPRHLRNSQGRPASDAERWISPDGTKSARLTTIGYSLEENAVTVRDLLTGEERSWTRPGRNHAGGMYIDGWLPDSRRLLIGECGFDVCDLSVLDLDDEPGPFRRRPVGVSSNPRWDHTERRGDGIVAVTDAGLEGRLLSAVYELDPDTLELGDRILGGLHIYSVDFDRSGRHLLYASLRRGRTLYRWHGGDLIPLRDGVLTALW